jgi:uncharacterized protein (TIGR02996 family)
VSDIASLLAACKLNPLEDTPRLVLADALDEIGDSQRAEFVRLQVRRPFTGGDWDADQPVIDVRALRLYKQNIRAWCGGSLVSRSSFTPQRDVGAEETNGVRGKFERGTLTLSGAPGELESVFEQLPAGAGNWLERLHFGQWDDLDSVRALLDHPVGRTSASLLVSWKEGPPAVVDLLDRGDLRELQIVGEQGSGRFLSRLAAARQLRPHKLGLRADATEPGGLTAILASPVVSEVRNLWCTLDSSPTGLEALARAPHLHRLEKLYLGGRAYPAALRSVFCSPVSAALADLYICGSKGKPHGVVAALAGQTELCQLERLDLDDNDITTADGETLARARAIEALVHLSCTGNITDDGLRALVTSPLLGPLEYLSLPLTRISDVALEALAGSPRMRRLRFLNVSRCRITERGIRALASSPYLSNLEYLNVGSNKLAPDALDALAESTQLGNLRVLGLGELTIAEQTLERLVNSPVVKQVTRLDMWNVPLGAGHLRALAGAKALSALRKFSIYDSRVDTGALNWFLSAPWLDGLAQLSLSEIGLRDEHVPALLRTLRSDNLGILHLEKNPLTVQSATALLDWSGLPALGELLFQGTSIPADAARQIKEVVYRPPV